MPRYDKRFSANKRRIYFDHLGVINLWLGVAKCAFSRRKKLEILNDFVYQFLSEKTIRLPFFQSHFCFGLSLDDIIGRFVNIFMHTSMGSAAYIVPVRVGTNRCKFSYFRKRTRKFVFVSAKLQKMCGSRKSKFVEIFAIPFCTNSSLSSVDCLLYLLRFLYRASMLASIVCIIIRIQHQF